MVSDYTEIIQHIVATHPTVKGNILLIGTNNVVKQQSEILKTRLQWSVEQSQLRCLSVVLYHQSEEELRILKIVGTEHMTFKYMYCPSSALQLFSWTVKFLRLNEEGIEKNVCVFFLHHLFVFSVKDKWRDKSRQEEVKTQHGKKKILKESQCGSEVNIRSLTGKQF